MNVFGKTKNIPGIGGRRSAPSSLFGKSTHDVVGNARHEKSRTLARGPMHGKKMLNKVVGGR